MPLTTQDEKLSRLDAAARNALLALVSRFEGDYWSLNLDGEFEGRFDQPVRDHHGERIPVELRRQHADFTPNPFSKYGHNPGHVGLSFGFIQFTQDGGGLGALLAAMQAEDGQAFREIFGADADELVRVTNLDGNFSRVADAAAPGGFARRSPRVAPVGGSELWQAPWPDRFKRAGRNPDFQRVQRRLAAQRYLDPMLAKVARPYQVQSQKGLCILLDRSVQLGPAGCARLIRAIWGAPEPHPAPERQRFEALYRAVDEKAWSHRVRKLLDSPELSFELRFALA